MTQRRVMLMVTAASAGTANPIVSTAEDAVSALTAFLSILLPVILAIVNNKPVAVSDDHIIANPGDQITFNLSGTDTDNDPLTYTVTDEPEIGTFIGQDALRSIADKGPSRRLVGLILEGRRAARQHMPVLTGGTTIGEVTSGCLSPTLEKSIAMAYVDAANAAPGTSVEVDLGKQTAAAEVVALPFYKTGS